MKSAGEWLMKSAGGVAYEMFRGSGLQNVQGEWLVKCAGGMAYKMFRGSGL